MYTQKYLVYLGHVDPVIWSNTTWAYTMLDSDPVPAVSAPGPAAAGTGRVGYGISEIQKNKMRD